MKFWHTLLSWRPWVKRPETLEARKVIWQKNLEVEPRTTTDDNKYDLLEAIKRVAPYDSFLQTLDCQQEVNISLWVSAFDVHKRTQHAGTAFVPLDRPKEFDRFNYTPLLSSQFRLFAIEPGKFNQKIRGRLIEATLTDQPKYSAISYSWMDPADPDAAKPVTIEINGQPTSIHTSQLRVLRRVRHESKVVLVWIDCLCISQTNMEERNHQVTLMSDIYSRASEVVVWLGEASESSEIGMRTLQLLADGRGFESNPVWTGSKEERAARGVEDIMRRSWFTRIWVVQEGALSSNQTTMLCGTHRVVWKSDAHAIRAFSRGLKYLTVSSQWRYPSRDFDGTKQSFGFKDIDVAPLLDILSLQADQVRRRYGIVMPDPDILDTAYSSRNRKSSVVKDQLYAILGMHSIRKGEFFLVDYTLTDEQVFDGFRQAMLAATEDERAAAAHRARETGQTAEGPQVIKLELKVS